MNADARDAARYRWLREQVSLDNSGRADIYIRLGSRTWEAAPQIKSDAHLDAAVDSGMRNYDPDSEGP